MLKKREKGTDSVKDDLFIFQYCKKLKVVKTPQKALEWLQEATDILANMDKQVLENFVLELKQISQDLKFKYYKARCKYILIPPEDSITFIISYVLGNLPMTVRYSSFEGEVQELLKVFSQADEGVGQEAISTINYLPYKEFDTALDIINEKFPIFYKGLTHDPILVPVFDFSITKGSLLSLVHLHSFGLFKSKSEYEEPSLSILHALAHILHYKMTDDLEVLPLGFINLQHRIFDDIEIYNDNWAETFADLFVASLLYETEQMSLVAFMELSNSDHNEINKYLAWLERIFASSLEANIQRLILRSEGLRA